MTTAIEHVVVMAMENRSFDHLLGYFSNIIPGLEGLQGNETNAGDPQRPPVTAKVAVVPDAYTRGPDPGHEPDNVARQLFGPNAQGFGPAASPTNSGFVWDYSLQRDNQGPIGLVRAESIMECFTSAQLPGVTALATAGVVCDKWFSSVPGPTWPNRFYIHCGTSGGLNRSPTNGEIIAAIEGNRPYKLPTIYEALDGADVSWRIYYDTVSQSMALAYVGDRYDDSRQCFGDHYDFLDDCVRGALPNYAFIEPKQWSISPLTTYNDMHPPHDVRTGDDLIASVYRALSRSKLWEKTLFVILFDEHGGFFDHVLPPGALDPNTPLEVKRLVVNPDGKLGENGFAFDRFGVRVPCILASPALTRVGPDHAVYDHSSLIASVRKLFGITAPLAQRDAVANDFCHLFEATATTRATPAAATALAPPAARPFPVPSYEESLFTLGTHFHIRHQRASLAASAPSKRARRSGPKKESKAARGAQKPRTRRMR